MAGGSICRSDCAGAAWNGRGPVLCDIYNICKNDRAEGVRSFTSPGHESPGDSHLANLHRHTPWPSAPIPRVAGPFRDVARPL